MIMTSEQNDAETRAFLKEHDYFGYSADNVHFFKQERNRQWTKTAKFS